MSPVTADRLPAEAGWSLEALLDHEPDRPAFRCGEHVATRAQLRVASERTAAMLYSDGFRRGDALALWMPDGGCWLQFLFAAARLGVLIVPISTRYREQEVRHVITTAQVKGAVVATDFLDFDFLSPMRAIQRETPQLHRVYEASCAPAFHPVDACLAPAPILGRAHDPLCTFSTSGTTGRPKLAVHDQESIACHARNVARTMHIGAGDVMLCGLPLYGVLGFVQSISALAAAADSIFLRVFRSEAAAEAIDRYGVTHFLGSDGMFAPVLETERSRLSTWRRGGFAEFAGLSTQVVDRAQTRLGLPLVGLYGSSECFAVAATQLPGDPPALRSMGGGVPISREIQFRIVDPVGGHPLQDGERGELQMRGYNVMSGYLNDARATAEAFTEDGWFRTGDLAYANGDRFFYLSRLKDGLRLRGYLVDPTEIEHLVSRHESVRDTQVVGVHRPGVGDIAVAFVRTLDPELTQEHLIAWCRSEMANYKVPSHVVFVDDYPRIDGPNGTKIVKSELREMALQLTKEDR